MDFFLKEHKILINEIGQFAVILDKKGYILWSNEKWISYCQKYQVPEALWKNQMNYMEWLQEAERNVELRSIREVLDGKAQTYTQMSPWRVLGEIYWFLIETKQFRMADGTTGVIVLIQKVKFSSRKRVS